MKLLFQTITLEIDKLHKENVRFTIIGDLDTIPTKTAKSLKDGITLTKNNKGLNLCLAINYGSRQEIINSIKAIAIQVQNDEININDINEGKIKSEFLYSVHMPDPDLLIRTGGEYRLSNFLLWQIAYTEIVMTDTFGPNFAIPTIT